MLNSRKEKFFARNFSSTRRIGSKPVPSASSRRRPRADASCSLMPLAVSEIFRLNRISPEISGRPTRNRYGRIRLSETRSPIPGMPGSDRFVNSSYSKCYVESIRVTEGRPNRWSRETIAYSKNRGHGPCRGPTDSKPVLPGPSLRAASDDVRIGGSGRGKMSYAPKT